MTMRERRLAENEALFRQINEQIQVTASRLGAGEADPHAYEYLCECSRRECMSRVRMSLQEYEEIRRSPIRFCIVDGHDLPEIERVVEERDGYVVIEKEDEAADVVAALDPRRS